MVARPHPEGTRRPRPNTMARFEAALARATERSIRVLAYRDGRAVVSASNGRDAYVTTEATCACAAGQALDPICVHRAALAVYLGNAPDPTPPAAPSVCPTCKGHGEVRKMSATFAGVTYRVACPCTRPAA